jgi:hypothetical protein
MRPSAARLTAAVSPALRPLLRLTEAQLAQRFVTALERSDGLEGAHCIHERWMRGEFAPDIEAALAALWAHAAASIPEWLPMRHVAWLPLAYELALRFRPGRRGRSNLYLVLLDYHDRRRGPFGAYVGMSHYRPAQRFDQHKAGIHAAGSVLKRGLEVLTGPTLHLQGVGRAAALQVEARLAEALSDAGVLVAGGH